MNHPVILFDGLCNLCAETVQFILKRDKKKKFRFASLQSEFGQRLLKENGMSAEGLNTFVLLENEKVHVRSSGALRVLRHLPLPWPVLYALIIVPPFIRNGIYDWVAKKRYQWFGKRNNCWLPKPEWKELFLD